MKHIRGESMVDGGDPICLDKILRNGSCLVHSLLVEPYHSYRTGHDSSLEDYLSGQHGCLVHLFTFTGENMGDYRAPQHQGVVRDYVKVHYYRIPSQT